MKAYIIATRKDQASARFDRAADRLGRYGHRVVNLPAQVFSPAHQRAALMAMLSADVVLAMPGAETDPQAQLELEVARRTTMGVYDYHRYAIDLALDKARKEMERRASAMVVHS